MFIDIAPMGNLGNRMLQYLGASALAARFPGAEITGLSLPEWGISTGKAEAPAADFFTLPPDPPDNLAQTLAAFAASGLPHWRLRDHMQRLDWLPARATARALFPAIPPGTRLADDELLINIRAAELSTGIFHYPLVPAGFYMRLLRQTGLRPVFLGQLDGSAYVQGLRARFPQARFVPSQGAMADFASLRAARHICIAVSTFSWLAAWLSEARQIHIPLMGFLAPALMRRWAIDLLPVDDPAYRFHLMPVQFGAPEAQILPRHDWLAALTEEISAPQLRYILAHRPFLPPAPPPVQVDEAWYCATYLPAAQEIAQGWHADAAAHYAAIGRQRGYLPLPAGFSYEPPPPGLRDFGLEASATQSSIGPWSVAASREDEAARALTGTPLAPCACHTDWEDSPWWQADLGTARRLSHLLILPRCDLPNIAMRTAPLQALASEDGHSWTELFRTPDGFIPGRIGQSLCWQAPAPFSARFVRLCVPRHSVLHLRQVRLLGPA